MSLKTNKSYAKRIKVSKNGKLSSKKAGHGHFNAKEGGEKKLAKHRPVGFVMSAKNQGRYLPYSK